MSLAIVHSRALAGIAAPSVCIEVHLSRGLPGFSIVGLPEKAVKESKDRVRSAIINSDLIFPTKRITVNLAPADLPKEGGRFDLPIALGILMASGQLSRDVLSDYEVAGELELSGKLRAIKGMLPFATAAQTEQRQLLLPEGNAQEAALVKNITVFAAKNILEVCAHLRGEVLLPPIKKQHSHSIKKTYPDLLDVKGQAHARRALEIAAAGGHSLLFIGPPGTGKTMLSSRLPGILPPMTDTEALEAAALYSISQSGFDEEQWGQRPFRSPHHSASRVALVGGGTPPRPGEISLAHGGVLFLDELPEFQRHVLESLREPLEAGTITISRASYQAQFPSRFQLIVSMNPCPCGYLTDPKLNCRCTEEQITRYQTRISGPLLDRIDMHVEVPPLPKGMLLQQSEMQAESSSEVRLRVIAARERQLARSGKSNNVILAAEIQKHCQLNKTDQDFFGNAVEQLGLSARAYHRILKLARTIADLDSKVDIMRIHLEEAFSYRQVLKS